jgi:hypothetical protein
VLLLENKPEACVKFFGVLKNVDGGVEVYFGVPSQNFLGRTDQSIKQFAQEKISSIFWYRKSFFRVNSLCSPPMKHNQRFYHLYSG